MTRYDSVISTIKGEVTGEPLISLWRHYPEHDLNIRDLVEMTLRDYRQYPSDVVKLSPQGRYCVVDFGCKIVKGSTDHKASGSTSCRECIVKTPQDWSKIENIDPLDGHYGDQITFVKQVSQQITDVPIMMTLFAPTMVARKLSSNLMMDHFRAKDNKELISALMIIEKVTIEFGRACIDAGANGIFMAIQEADKKNVTTNIEAESILSQNAEFVKVMNQKAEFTVNHIHGDEIYFQEAIQSISSNAINWHDQTSEVDLESARSIFKGGLFGGLDPDQIYHGITPDYFNYFKTIREEIPLILSPGCVILQQTSESTLRMIFDEYKKV